MSPLRSAALRGIYRAGWVAGAYLPESLVHASLGAVSWAALRQNGWHVQNLRHNLTVATGTAVSEDLVRAGLASHFRNVYESLALPGWSAEQVVSRVTTSGEPGLRDAHSYRGAVVALPHSGNWDLAGAWACRTGLPVTSIAEELPEREFQAFLSFRRGLGMEVLSHRDRGALPALIRAVRNGRVVCLLADRDLSASGVPVTWRGVGVTMPAGPALVARRTGAALLPAVSTFTPRGMHLSIGPVIDPVPGGDGLRAMTQQVADYFAARIAERPQDWHMLQPFFPSAATKS